MTDAPDAARGDTATSVTKLATIETGAQVKVPAHIKKGDKIKVNDGAFVNFEGEVDDIIPDKGMVRIITTIFGRPTPLELEYWQIEKM